MAKFTQWSIFVTSGKPFPEIRQAAINFLNKFQNLSPPEGKDQSEYGLLPSGEVYQNLFAIVQGVQIAPMSDGTAGDDTTMEESGMMTVMPTDTTRMDGNIRELNYLATVLSDTATAAFTSVPLGVGYIADFQTFSNKTELAAIKKELTVAMTTAIAEIELKPGLTGLTVPAADVAALVVADPSIQNIISNEIAKSITDAVNVDQIRIQSVQATLDRVNAPQIFEEVSARLFNSLSQNSDDIISTANLNLFRSIITQFQTKITALESRISVVEE